MVSMAVLLTWKKFLFLILFTSCSAQTTYYITPTPDTSCPGEPCHTLPEYVANHYFKNLPANTTMEFLPGNHSLEQTISLANLTWLKLQGDSASLPEITSRIVCTWPAGFVFTGISQLHISALALISCGHHDRAAVSAVSVQLCDISKCIFQNMTNYNHIIDDSVSPFHIAEGLLTSNLTLGNSGGALVVVYSTLILTGSIFQENSAADFGGALVVVASTVKLTGNTFQNNFAEVFGGALSVGFYSTLSLVDNRFENNYVNVNGGALSVGYYSTLVLTENTFRDNYANFDGGALTSADSNLTLTGNVFQSNSAANFGGVIAADRSILILTVNTFQNNFASYSGGVFAATRSTLDLMGNRIAHNSAASFGGALTVRSSNLTLTGNTFENNRAILGGTLYMEASDMTFTNDSFTNSYAQLGGAILVNSNSRVRTHEIMIGNCTAQYGGGIAALHSHIQLSESTIFENNSATYGGGLYAHDTECNGSAIFAKNSATEGGGGIYASRSIIFWMENTVIVNNAAMDGGGVLLSGDSKLYLGLQSDIAVHLISNSAKRTGGAIKVEDCNPLTYCSPSTAGNVDVSNNDCFFQIQSQQFFLLDRIAFKDFIISLNAVQMIYFNNNSAAEAGTDLYGGSVDNCTLNNIIISPFYSGPRSISSYVFDAITSSENKPNISSDPLNICTCRDDQTDCSGYYHHPEAVYPGGTLEIPVIAHGQRSGTTPAVIQVINSFNDIRLGSLEYSQNISNSCNILKYTIHSRALGTPQDITLYAEGPCSPTQTNTLTVTVDIQHCPPGFQLSVIEPTCVCAERLQRFTNTCLVDNTTVLRVQDAEFWVGYDNGSESRGLILHPHCPFDYCVSKEIYLAVNDSDRQCNYNRSGLLCGTCSENLSLALGSSRCLQCSNSYLSLLAAFAFAGIALVLLLLVLRLTVAAGTINGLIFYANVVAVNSAIFFQPKTTTVPAILLAKVFIAWMNLDLGIETCFYNGMNAYAATWLQFVFPLYVWALVGMIILGSYYSGRVAKVFGSNPIAVLGTLFLLSYAKLLRTVIAALSYTSLQYPNNSQIAVWSYDGNIQYLGSKHIPLFMAAMVCLIFLFLPYTILLVFGQCFQAKSGFKIFSWINNSKITSFLDTYHAPYTDKHRYWTGLMLLLRFFLFLIPAVNTSGNPSTNLLASAIACILILSIVTILGGRVYKTLYLRLLETSFIFNLAILTVASYHVRFTSGNQNTVMLISVSIAFTTFAGIVIYHSIQQINDTPQARKIFSKLFPFPKTPDQSPEKRSGVDYGSSADRLAAAPTTTVIDLGELHSYMLREPCMESNQ